MVGCGEMLASKICNRFWFLRETWVLLISQVRFPLSRCVHFLSTLSSDGWIGLCLDCLPSFLCHLFYWSTVCPHPPSFLASETVLLLSPPLSLSLWISTPPLSCHCILAPGGIGGKWVCSTAEVTQRFLSLGFLLLAANGILMLSTVFSHRNILWHGI